MKMDNGLELEYCMLGIGRVFKDVRKLIFFFCFPIDISSTDEEETDDLRLSTLRFTVDFPTCLLMACFANYEQVPHNYKAQFPHDAHITNKC